MIKITIYRHEFLRDNLDILQPDQHKKDKAVFEIWKDGKQVCKLTTNNVTSMPTEMPRDKKWNREFPPAHIMEGKLKFAYTPGKHRGRPALTNQGVKAVIHRRGNKGPIKTSKYIGLNVHDDREVSHGCVLVPVDFIIGCYYLCYAYKDCAEKFHPDGRPLVDFELIEVKN